MYAARPSALGHNQTGNIGSDLLLHTHIRSKATSGFQVASPDPLGRMATIREPDASAVPVMPLVAILDEEGQMTGITCPLNVEVDPHDIEGCEDLLESYFMQVTQTVTCVHWSV